jgi:predicted aspartyl protease
MARHTGWLLSIAWLFTCSAVAAESYSVEGVLPFKMGGRQLILVQGSIGTLNKSNLVIDTGAYPTVIDREVARKLGLSGRTEQLDAVDRTVSGMAVVLPKIEVGPIQATRVRSLVQDLSDVSRRAGVRIDALVGLNVLARSSFLIDYDTKKIFFGRLTPLPNTVPFHLANARLCVDLQAGSRSVRMLVDTGAEKVMLFASHVPWIPRSDRAQAFTNLGGSFVLREVRLDELQLGDTSLSSEPVYLSARNMPIYSFDGFLSTIQFRQVAFDFEREQFGWVSRDERKDRIRVASKPSSTPPYGHSFADEIPSRHSLVSGKE